MNLKKSKERIKSLLLTLLLAASVFQAGILWSEVNDGFPFFSLDIFLNNEAVGIAATDGTTVSPQTPVLSYRPEISVSDTMSLIIKPYRVTICGGAARSASVFTSHHMLPRDGVLFSSLLSLLGGFCEDLTSIPPDTEYPVEGWGELVSRRGILVEFKTPLHNEVIAGLINRTAVREGIVEGIRKLLIVPEVIAGKQSVCIYALLRDRVARVPSQSSVYYDVQKIIDDGIASIDAQTATNIGVGDVTGVITGDDTGIGERDSADTGAVAALPLAVGSFRTISEIGGASFPLFAPDVFTIVDGPKTAAFKRLKYTAPVVVRDKTELENIILASDIYSYNRSLDYDDTLVFKNLTSIYRLYKNGFMEYNYIPLTTPDEKGSLFSALEKVSAYTLNIESQLLGGADLYLSGIYTDESDLSYRFTFDYIIDNYPVHFNYTQKQGNVDIVYRNAISITANANRTLSCRWMLVDLYFATESKDFHTYFDRIDVGQSINKMAVSDINIAYAIDLNGGTEVAANEWPVWALTATDGNVSLVQMTEGER